MLATVELFSGKFYFAAEALSTGWYVRVRGLGSFVLDRIVNLVV